MSSAAVRATTHPRAGSKGTTSLLAAPPLERKASRSRDVGSLPAAPETIPVHPGMRLQLKLSVGSTSDPLERDADRVADRVMRMADPGPAVADPVPTGLRRKCAACQDEDEAVVRTKAAPTSPRAGIEAPSIVHDVLRTGGQPMEKGLRDFFEPRFGADFGNVRLHTDPRAADSAAAVGALAYTVGNHVVLGAGQFPASSGRGGALLAHELAHVVQQGGSGFRQGSAPVVRRLAGPEIPVSPQAIEEMHALLRQFTALSESGAVTATETAEVTTAVAEAEAALATATEVVAAGTTAVSIGDATLVASGALAADDVTGVGVADDVAIPFLLVGAAVAFGVGFLIGSSAQQIADATRRAADAVRHAIEAMRRAIQTARPQPQTQTQTQTQTQPQTQTDTQTQTRTRRRVRPCRQGEPCEEPLPIAWPTELPNPTGVSPRPLIRTDRGDLEWQGVERGDTQRSYADELRQYRARNMPLPEGDTCFPEDSEPNVPLDAHHIHPMYLNGEDATWNLCGLETLRHHRGHARLDNQTPFLPVYEECGICSPFLKDHPSGQSYIIVAEK